MATATAAASSSSTPAVRKMAMFSARPWERESFGKIIEEKALASSVSISYFDVRLTQDTVKLVEGHEAVCCFVNDRIDNKVMDYMVRHGVKVLLMRCAGFNNVDLNKAAHIGLRVFRVPAYSPEAVAEHAVALLMTLNRKTHRAYNKVREGNFRLDGLLGFDVCGRTVGVIGTGRIGAILARIMGEGFRCKVVLYDVFENDELKKLGYKYVTLDELYAQSDIISLHCPLMPQTHHLINEEALNKMKDGVMLINTSRGGLIDTKAVINSLKSGKIGALGLDVYEEEEALFFEDLSDKIIPDDTFTRLMSFPNVLITGHQAFFTSTALNQIATTTVNNLVAFLLKNDPIAANEVRSSEVKLQTQKTVEKIEAALASSHGVAIPITATPKM